MSKIRRGEYEPQVPPSVRGLVSKFPTLVVRPNFCWRNRSVRWAVKYKLKHSRAETWIIWVLRGGARFTSKYQLMLESTTSNKGIFYQRKLEPSGVTDCNHNIPVLTCDVSA